MAGMTADVQGASEHVVRPTAAGGAGIVYTGSSHGLSWCWQWGKNDETRGGRRMEQTVGVLEHARVGSGARAFGLPLAIGLGAFGGYAVVAIVAASGLLVQSGYPHYVFQADAWLHHSWWVVAQPTDTQTRDMTLFQGHLYVAFPPLPALILLPFVAIFGLNVWDVLISVGLGALNAALLAIALRRLSGWGVDVSPAARLWLCGLFAFGSETLYATVNGSVWFFAHVVALTFTLLGMIECLTPRRRPLVAALWFGLAGMARPDAWAGAIFFVVLEAATLLPTSPERVALLWTGVRRVALLAGGMLLFPLLGAAYNQARFGSPTDLGYQSMNVAPQLLPDLQQFGQFSLHFVGKDLYYMFLAPPLFDSAGAHPDPWGMSIFLVSPALLYLLGSFRIPRARPIAWAAIAAVLLTAVPLITYYNTGWWQFGSRFSIDFLPFLILLTALGVRGRATWLLGLLTLAAVGMNIWGTLWFFGKLS